MKYLKELMRKKYEVVAIHQNFGQLNDGSKYRTRRMAVAWADHLNLTMRRNYKGYATKPWVYVVKEI